MTGFTLGVKPRGTRPVPPVEAGSSNDITLEITNNRDETISNVDAEFSASNPLSVEGDSVFIQRLESQEQTEVDVTVSASSGATPNPYPLDVDFQYDDEDGNTRLSEVFSVQIDVEEGDDSFPVGILLIGIAIIAAVIIIAVARRRDSFESIYS